MGLDVELGLSFDRYLSRRSFSIFSIRSSSSAGSLGPRWGFQVYRPIRPKARIRDGSWLSFEQTI